MTKYRPPLNRVVLGPDGRPFYQATLEKHLPPFIRVRWKRGRKLTPADAVLWDRTMLIPKPYTIEALAVGLHESGHFKCKHFNRDQARGGKRMRKLLKELYTGNGRLSRAHEEFEAETWARDTLRREGIPVTGKAMRSMKEYVKECLEKDHKKGKRNPHQVKRFVKHYHV